MVSHAFGLTTLFVASGVMVLTGLWYYEEQHTTSQTCKESVRTSVAPGQYQTRSQHGSCPTKNIDVFIVTEKTSLALVEWTVRSIELFMPCRGDLHIVCEPGETAMVLAFVGNVEDVKIHEMERPKSLATASAYHMMQWPQFWADKYVSPTADYVMFMDSDSILTLPVTCRALFSPEGKILLPAWRWDTSPQFSILCKEALGRDCPFNFMNYYPFLFPVRLLGPLREHIVKNRKASNFNNAIWTWDQLAPSRNPPNSGKNELSQFVVFGNYLFFNHPDVVHIPRCFHRAQMKEIDDPKTGCRDYVHPGVHYAWRPCNYVADCAIMQQHYHLFGGDGKFYSNKFSVELMPHLTELIVQGLCFMRSLSPSSTFPPFQAGERGGCTSKTINSIHPEALTYQTLHVNMTVQRLKFSPDPFQHLCPSVHLRTTETKDYEEKDDMMA